MKFEFSYKQEIYDELTEGARHYLEWKNEEKIWKYKNCNVTVLEAGKNRVRIVLKRKLTGKSKFINSDYSLNLMMGFIATNFSEPTQQNKKWVIEFTVEKNGGKDLREIKEVRILSENQNDIKILYSTIKENFSKIPNDADVFDSNVKKDERMIPVIYQPRIDAWKNFLREVHIKKRKRKYEVTLVFNDEVLRKHSFLDLIYRLFRLARYKRTKDIETFFIDFENENFNFPGIYSGKYTLYYDNIHEDKPEDGAVPNRKIKYFFQDKNHPIIFINTSNHAMAHHDNNHDFWKWEYIPWDENTPIKMGDKAKDEVNNDLAEF